MSAGKLICGKRKCDSLMRFLDLSVPLTDLYNSLDLPKCLWKLASTSTNSAGVFASSHQHRYWVTLSIKAWIDGKKSPSVLFCFCLDLRPHGSQSISLTTRQCLDVQFTDTKRWMSVVGVLCADIWGVLTCSCLCSADSYWHCMMPPENKKHGCLPTDLLSNLPENVMNAILMRLPLRDAARTSILSNKWRYKWCRLPQLTLDDELWDATNDLLSPSIKFTNIMYHILTLHSGPITTFTLSIYELKKYPKIGSLIYFLSRNDIQHLVLEFSEWNRYRLPSSFFTCSQLRHLTLRNCVICPPPAFKGFDMLICLELRYVTISFKLLESLISHSSLLEKLVLEISDTLDHIQIKAPKLRSFDFRGCLKNISLEDVPLLAKLSLFYGRSFKGSEKCDLDRFFQSLPALEHLYLEGGSVQFLVAGAAEVPRRLSFPFNHIKRLYVSVDVLDDLSCALCLIRNSPCLQDLEMQVYCEGSDKYSGEPVAIDEVDEVFARFSDVTLNHLRMVHLEGVKDVKLHMQLIKLLLTKSPMLVKMLIKPSTQPYDYSENRNKIVAELTIIQRASCKVEVVVYDDFEDYY